MHNTAFNYSWSAEATLTKRIRHAKVAVNRSMQHCIIIIIVDYATSYFYGGEPATSTADGLDEGVVT